MSWKPKGWKNLFNPAAVRVEDRNGKPISHYDAYQLGADAMLEWLRQTGYEIKAGESFGDERTGARTIVNVNGRVVFIPEEHEEV